MRYEIDAEFLYSVRDDGKRTLIAALDEEEFKLYLIAADGEQYPAILDMEFLKRIVKEHKQRDEILLTSWYVLAKVNTPWEDKPVYNPNADKGFFASIRR